MIEARNDAFQIWPQEKLLLSRVTFYISLLAYVSLDIKTLCVCVCVYLQWVVCGRWHLYFSFELLKAQVKFCAYYKWKFQGSEIEFLVDYLYGNHRDLDSIPSVPHPQMEDSSFLSWDIVGVSCVLESWMSFDTYFFVLFIFYLLVPNDFLLLVLW